MLTPDSRVENLEVLLNDLVHAINHRRQSILNKYQVSEQEVEIIDFLLDDELRKMKQVGEHFGIKLSTLTSTIDKLEKNKLVKRKNSREDRRVIYIRPTAKGDALIKELNQTIQDLAARLTNDLPAAEF